MTRNTGVIRREAAFTLIELLIMIIVLGILAAIVVYAVGDTKSNAVEAACRTTLTSVELSAEAYHTKNGAYPAAGDDADLADPALGSLLKSWPAESSPDYSFDWTGTQVEVFNTKVAPAVSTGFGEAGCAALP